MLLIPFLKILDGVSWLQAPLLSHYNPPFVSKPAWKALKPSSCSTLLLKRKTTEQKFAFMWISWLMRPTVFTASKFCNFYQCFFFPPSAVELSMNVMSFNFGIVMSLIVAALEASFYRHSPRPRQGLRQAIWVHVRCSWCHATSLSLINSLLICWFGTDFKLYVYLKKCSESFPGLLVCNSLNLEAFSISLFPFVFLNFSWCISGVARDWCRTCSRRKLLCLCDLRGWRDTEWQFFEHF